jgi:fumarate reductase (CoM/CoB) subunit A
MSGGTMKEIKADVLIIGSEAAGAKAAIEAQDDGADVLVVSKGLVGKSGNTVMAGWGIQAPISHMYEGDSPEVFFEDVVKGGAYLNNQKLLERLVNLAVTEVPKMEKWGAKFMKKGEKFIQFQLPGSSYPRTLHPVGRHGGLQWRKAFRIQFKRLNTKVIEDLFVTKILVSDGKVAGVLGVSLRDGEFILIRSKIVLLATGGCTDMFLMNDGSRDATGDGFVLALRAGAQLMDMEFHQCFPLSCYTPPFEFATFTANLRYVLHGKMYNSLGEAFMERYLPLSKDWGLRDPTSRAIYLENKYGRGSPHGGAWIAVNHLPENLIDDWIQREKPAYIPKLEKAGIDIRKHALECGPAAHYTMGGVRVNENCESAVQNLFAVGEVASGPDGAERIDGGPAITWCLGMGYIAGKEAARRVGELSWIDIDKDAIQAEQKRVTQIWERQGGVRGFEIKNKIKKIMWEECALVRSGDGLDKALKVIDRIKREDLPNLTARNSSKVLNKGLLEALEAQNMVEIAEMTVRSALMREESRRSHYRTDFLNRDDKNWLKNTIIKSEGDSIVFRPESPIITKMKPPTEEEVEKHDR